MTLSDFPEEGSQAWLERAVADNHRALFRVEAHAAGGEERAVNGITWTYNTAVLHATIAFPVFPTEGASLILDQLMDAMRGTPPSTAGLWSLDPPRPSDLGAVLLARGFQPGWRPNWMGLKLGELFDPGPALQGSSLEINADNESDLRSVRMLPYADSSTALKYKMAGGHGVLLQRFVARLEGMVVGHACILGTEGPTGVAGIYEVGVLHQARRRGIGRALVQAACAFAKGKGYAYAVLNSTLAGRSIYEQVGFRSFGEGWTWWLMNDRWIKNPLTETEIKFAEAIGRGDMGALSQMMLPPRPLTNGMSWMELAVHLGQPLSAVYLMRKGVPLRPLEAWDLGWKDQAALLLRAMPSLANELYGEGKVTLLHTAVERNDEGLAGLVLSVGPDLDIRDHLYKGTALDWAKYLGRGKMQALIEGSGPGRASDS